jgi:hypothetical protein
MTAKGSAMNEKDAKQLTELTREQLEAVAGGASARQWRRVPRPRNKVGNRPR